MGKRNDKVEDIMISKLQEDLDRVQNDITPQKYDFSDSKTRRDLVKEVFEFERKFAAHEQQSRRMQGRESYFDYLSDIDDCYISRKSDAIGNYARFVYEKYAEQYPLIDVIDVFKYMNSNGMFSYDIYSLSMYFELAAALYILDELQVSLKMNDAMAYFPDPEKLAEIYCPGITDSCHETRTIKSMMYIIRNRDNDGDNVQRDAFFINEATAANRKHRQYEIHDPEDNNITNRQRFDSVMALIHPAIRERVQKRFEENMWEAFEIVLSVCYPYREKEVAALKKVKQNMLELKEYFDDRKKATSSQKNVFAPLADPQKSLDVFLVKDRNEPTFDKKLEFMSAAVDKQMELAQKCNFDWVHAAMASGQADLVFKDREKREEMGEEAVEKLLSLQVKNPFESCFALLYLLDQGSDLPWLCGMGLSVMGAVSRKLPWYYDDEEWDEDDDETDPGDEDPYISEDDPADNDISGDAEEETEASDELLSLDDYTPRDWIEDEAKLYEMRYDNHWDWPSYEEIPENKLRKLNFSQVAYMSSRTLFPRNIYYELGLGEDLEVSGFEKGQGEIMERLITVLDSVWARESYSRRFDQGDEASSDMSSEDANREFETMAADHEALKKQFVELKDTYHETHREKNRLSRRVSELSNENEALKEEIAELRSMISSRNNQEKGNAEDNEQESAVEFPYTAKRRYVIFGGHDSWAKAIKPLLKGDNVKFVSPYTRPDASLIRHADVVFIQNNAISHADYYKIMNIVRSDDIPVEYFAYSSAEKCVEQLARYDMESGR